MGCVLNIPAVGRTVGQVLPGIAEGRKAVLRVLWFCVSSWDNGEPRAITGEGGLSGHSSVHCPGFRCLAVLTGPGLTLSAPSGPLVQHSLVQECSSCVCTQNTSLRVGQGEFQASLFPRDTGDSKIQSCWKLRSVWASQLAQW